MNDTNNNLDHLVELSQQAAQAQRSKLEAQLGRSSTVPRGKQVFAAGLAAALVAVLLMQYPRFAEPYVWPDPASNPGAAEADLIAVVGMIETFRIALGQLPTDLGQVPMPQTLAQRTAGAMLVYRPLDQDYTLEWPLPHWRATYDSRSAKISVEPVGKK